MIRRLLMLGVAGIPTLLSAQVQVMHVATVTDAAGAEAGDPDKQGEVVVTGQRAKPAQVDTTGRVGILGNRDTFDTPFATTSYTDKLIADQQVRSIADVAVNDPSVRAGSNRYADTEVSTIRGFPVYGDSTLFNGVANLVSYRRTSLEGIARVEIFKGPNGLLNNATGNFSVGGSINVVPKRAGDTPVTDLTASFISDGEFGGHLDLGRRFGADRAFGVRVNVAGRSGSTPLDHQREHYVIATAGLDWRSETIRASLDVDYQRQALHANTVAFTVAPGVAIPKPPKASSNIFDRSSLFRQQSLFALGQAEADLADKWTLYGSLGAKRYTEYYRGPYSPRILNAAGAVSVTDIPYYRRPTLVIGQIGLRGSLATGPVDHALTLSADGYRGRTHQVFTLLKSFTTNLYDPVDLSALVTRNAPDTDPPLSARTAHGSVALADVATALDGRVTLVAGVRYQAFKDSNYSIATGARTSYYNKSATTPGFAVMVKPVAHLSLYANYIQALQSGSAAPTTAANAGEVLAPFRAKQVEAGAKYDFGSFGATFAAYRIEQPSTYTDPVTNRFGAFGKQRNKGLELEGFGTVVTGARLLGGVSRIDAEQVRTPNGVTDGRDAIGTPKTQVNLGGELDVPGLSGLTLTARGLYTSHQYYDAANTQGIPHWTRIDLGGRYAFTAGRHALTARLSVENAFGKDYWQSSQRSQLSLGAPRTLLLSLTAGL